MNNRIFAFDFVRTVSILLIVSFHFESAVEHLAGKQFSLPFYEMLGKAGVSMFFILSGAALFLSSENSPGKFYLKRFLAIYPLFWACYLFYFGIGLILGEAQLSNAHPLSAILTIMGMDGFMSYQMKTYYLIGEWFLGCIIIIYLLFPLLQYYAKRNVYILVGVCFTLCIAIKSFYAMEMPLLRFPFFRLFEFVLGMYLTRFFVSRTTIKDYLYCGLIILLAFIIFSIHPSSYYFYKNICIGIACFLFLSIVSLGIRKKLDRIIAWLSIYSYGVFLVHHPIVDNLVLRTLDYITIPGYHVGLFILAILLSYSLSFIVTSCLNPFLKKVRLKMS